MRNKKENRRLFIGILIILIIISYVAVFSYNYWTKILANQKETERLKNEYTKLLEKEKNLNSEINKLQDPEYVAKYARERYLMSKEGELIIKVPDEES